MLNQLFLFALAIQSPLDSDPKLATHIAIECPAETVGELLAKIGSQVGEPITAAPSIRNDMIVMLVKDRPAKECLATIASHFSWAWERGEEGLRLIRTPKQQIDEEKAADDDLLTTYRNWRQQSLDALKTSTKPTDRDDYEKLIDGYHDLLSRYNTEYFSSDLHVRDKWVESSQINERSRAEISRRMSPRWQLVDRLIAGMSDADLLSLDRTHKLVYSSMPGSWQRALPSSLTDLAVRSVEDLSRRSGNQADEAIWQNRDLLAEANSAFTPADVAAVRILFMQAFRVDPNYPAGFPTGTYSVIGRDRSLLAVNYATARGLQSMKSPPKKSGSKVLDEPFEETEWIRQARDSGNGPSSYWSKAFNSAMEDFLKPGSTSLPYRGSGQIIIEVARAANLDLISDVHDRSGWLSLGMLPLVNKKQTLDLFSNMVASKWSLDGGWLKIRSRHWQFDRRDTIPADRLLKIRDDLVDGDYSFDSLAAAAQKVTNRQFSGPTMNLLVRKTGWNVVDRDDTGYNLLQFWANTPQPMRERLLSGQTVSFGDLNRAQKSSLEQFAYAREDMRYISGIFASEDYGLETADVQWLKQNWPGYGAELPPFQDQEPTQALPNGLPPEARVGFRASQGNALILSNSNGWSMPLSELQTVMSGYYKPDTDFLAIPATENRLFFSLIVAPQSGFGVELTSISRPPSTSPKPFSELPEEIRRRLEKAYQQRHSGG